MSMDEDETDEVLQEKGETLTREERHQAGVTAGDIKAQMLMSNLNKETATKRSVIFNKMIAEETNVRLQAERSWKEAAKAGKAFGFNGARISSQCSYSPAWTLLQITTELRRDPIKLRKT